MQTWARRGLQTALVTGGLLMLGTGIASADEDVNPDRPASPLDTGVTIPVKMDNNAIGTPAGQVDLPAVEKEIDVSVGSVVDTVTKAVPAAGQADQITDQAAQTAKPVTEQAAPVAGQAEQAAAPVTDQVTEAAPAVPAAPVPGLPVPADLAPVSGQPMRDHSDTPVTDGVAAATGDGALHGNRVTGDLVVPIDISGNALALGGSAEVENDSQQSAGVSAPVVTNGTGGFLAGNVVDLDWALPVQVTGNAVSVVGDATATSTASQTTTADGDITTDGSDGVLSGTVLAGQGATPVQVTGNAVSGGGHAEANSTADSSATAGGYVLTNGADSLGGGNVGALPVATPLEANGNAITGVGNADANSTSSATTTAGAEREGLYGVPTYVETNGDPAAGAGNVVQPSLSGPANLCGNAAAGVGDADAECTSETESTAGGTTRSTGEGSVLSGSTATAPVSLPSSGTGNTAAAVGEADATSDTTVSSDSGGDSYTRGHDSLASGAAATAPVSAPADVCGNAAAGAGDSTSECVNDVESTAGGHTGTTGDDSLGGGNMVTSPVSSPVETFGNTGGAIGSADATAEETKESTAGGGSNTDDDHGVLASNLVNTPVATAGQVFGNGAGAVAYTDAAATADNTITAGGPSKATGTGGTGSGNIVQTPVSGPVQAFGTGATGLGHGTQAAVADTVSTSGGDATSDGTDGFVAGNVVSGPVGGAGQAYGESAAALGMNESLAGSATDTTAGGTTDTSGASGFGSGNVAAAQALPLAQSFAAVASGVGGDNESVATNDTSASSGGDIATNGDAGFLSGNLADVPAAGVAQPFADAASAVASQSSATGYSDTEGSAGGTSTTSGEVGQLSGIDGTVPVGANAPVYDVPVEVLAEAMTDGANSSDITVGEGSPQIDEPLEGTMGATEMPTVLPATSRTMAQPSPADALARLLGGVSGIDGLGGLVGGGAPGGVPGTDVLGGIPGMDAFGGMTGQLPGQTRTLPAADPKNPATTLVDGFVNGMTGLPGQDVVANTTGAVQDATPAGAVDPAPGEFHILPYPYPQRDLPNVPGVPGIPAVPGGVPQVPGFDGLGDPTDLPFQGDLTDLPNASGLPQVPAVPGALPQVPGAGEMADLPLSGDLSDMPEFGSVPGLDTVTDAPVVQAPSLNGVNAPALSDVDTNGTAVPGQESLADTKAALAGLFASHPIG